MNEGGRKRNANSFNIKHRLEIRGGTKHTLERKRVGHGEH